MATKTTPILWICVFLFSGCAAKQSALPPPASSAPAEVAGLGENPIASGNASEDTSENTSWWICRFKLTWPPKSAPDLTADLLIAHAVVRPVLNAHANNIPLWRFHRRAARDETGHQFSFLFYSNPKVSREVTQGILRMPLLQKGLEANLIETISCDDPGQIQHPEIEAMSDPRWSPSLKKNWPAYIMGASALWLGLIDDAMGEAGTEIDDILILHEKYREVSQEVIAIWYQEGQHAFLHHLSAVFGYEPLLIRTNIAF